jgi:putative membrane protein
MQTTFQEDVLPLAESSSSPHTLQRQLWFKAIVLLGLAAYFVWVIASGNISNYINERFAWLSYLAAGIFIMLGAYTAWQALANAKTSITPMHRSFTWGALLITAIPLVLGTLVPSRPLGAESVAGNISMSNASAANVAQFSINPLERNVLDWLRVFNSTTDFSELNGQPADVIGFVYKEATFAEDQFMIARYSVSCCVADASALGVPAHYETAAELEQGQWVRITGAFQVEDFREELLPVLQVANIELIEQPKHPYLYP